MLSIYQQLGVEFFDFDGVKFKKMIATCTKPKRVVSMEIEDKHTATYYPNLIWDMIS